MYVSLTYKDAYIKLGPITHTDWDDIHFDILHTNIKFVFCTCVFTFTHFQKQINLHVWSNAKHSSVIVHPNS
jgi:hypothetical protein